MKSILKPACLAVLFLLSTFINFSHAQNFEWAKVDGNWNQYQNGYSFCWPYGVTSDNAGNVYSTASYWDTLRLKDTVLVSRINNNYTQNLFIVKYSPTGQRLWVRNFPKCRGVDGPRTSAVRIDNNGDVIFAGYATDSVMGQYIGSKTFLCKITQSGQLVWLKKFGQYVSFTLDNAGNIYTLFTNHTSYPATFDALTINPVNSYLIGKMNAAGQAQWVKQFPTTDPLAFRAAMELNPAQTELLVRHQYTGTVTFPDTTLTSATWGNYVARFSSTTGEKKKVIPVITSNSFEMTHATWANNSTIVFTGNNQYTSTYKIGDSTFNVGADNGASHSVTIAIDTAGRLFWHQLIGRGELNTVAVAGDKVYVAGAVSTNSSINGDTVLRVGNWQSLSMITCYDLYGSFRSYTLGGITQTAHRYMYLSSGPQNKVYAMGYYTEWYPWGPFYGLFGADTVLGAGRGGVFYGKLQGHESICAGENISFASSLTGSSYQWQLNTGPGFAPIAAGGSVFSGITTPTLQLTNVPAGYNGYIVRCLVDGIPGVTQILNVNDWPATPTVSATASTITCGNTTTLQATVPNCSNCWYTWTPPSTLNRSWGASVTAKPTATTTYVASVIKKGCVATNQVTVTVNCTTTGIPSLSNDHHFNVSPNPVRSEVLVKVKAKKSGTATIRISDALGRTVFNSRQQVSAGDQQIRIDMKSLSNGVYYLLAIVDGVSFASKIVVEK